MNGRDITMASALVIAAAAGASSMIAPCFSVFPEVDRWFERPGDPGRPYSEILDQVEEPANKLIKKIEDFYKRKGRYPCALKEAELSAPWTSWGSLRYQVVSQGRKGERARYVLRITPTRSSIPALEYDSQWDEWDLQE